MTPEESAGQDEPAAQPSGEPRSGEQPSEEELREQLEEEIRKVRVEDVVLQSVVSILNLAARRIAKDDERDLAQAKVGIDAARALVDLVKPEAQPQLRQAISELQVLYAKHAGEGTAGEEGPKESEEPAGETRGGSAGEAEEPPVSGEGAKKADSPLWTPPGTGDG
ncbi:MAG: hypothetical protein ACRDK5_05005 [Solirubrobacterales bacterium]